MEICHGFGDGHVNLRRGVGQIWDVDKGGWVAGVVVWMGKRVLFRRGGERNGSGLVCGWSAGLEQW